MIHQKTTRLLLLLLLLLLLRLTSPAEVDPEQEIIVDSSPCSVTCGLGLRRQNLCLLKDSRTAIEEGDAEVTKHIQQTPAAQHTPDDPDPISCRSQRSVVLVL